VSLAQLSVVEVSICMPSTCCVAMQNSARTTLRFYSVIFRAPRSCCGLIRNRRSLIGNVVTIKLSENQENVMQNDATYATMIVETHFQVSTPLNCFYSSVFEPEAKKARGVEC
jgi:hypothetical protein